jgi:hypothetical protein
VREDAGVAVRRILGRTYQEVALDFYAQADHGTVWYFGEDVYNSEKGAVADTEAPGSPARKVPRR